QGTAFTYQGRLSDNGAPANGSYDLRFTLYDAIDGSNAVAGPLVTNAEAISNGQFSLSLDFGSGVFNGSDRWLELAMRTNTASSFTLLTPRQQIMPAPYAIYAANAAAAATVGNASVGTIQLASNSVTAAKIASGQVVKTFNGMHDDVVLSAGANISLATNGNLLQIAAVGAGTPAGWSLTGNSGTTPGTNFLG